MGFGTIHGFGHQLGALERIPTDKSETTLLVEISFLYIKLLSWIGKQKLLDIYYLVYHMSSILRCISFSHLKQV